MSTALDEAAAARPLIAHRVAGARETGGKRRAHVYNPATGVVIGEVALAVVLTVGAGLLLRSFATLLAVDPGFRPENLLTLQIQLPSRISTPDARRGFYADMFARLDSLPGVVASGGTTRLPLGSTNVTTRVMVEGRAMTAATMPISSDPGATMRPSVPLMPGVPVSLKTVPSHVID